MGVLSELVPALKVDGQWVANPAVETQRLLDGHGRFCFGEPKSGGCVNVSPIDGKWLFEFTEPPIPDGWHGVRWRPNVEPATTFIVHH